MKLITWNVNGVRASYKKGLLDFIEEQDPDILCLQETKAHVEQLTAEQINPVGLKSYWSSGQRKGYSGTATFCKKESVDFRQGIGNEKFDTEGRFSITDHQDFLLYNIYFPNGSSRKERHDYKQEFLSELNDHLKEVLASGREVIVTGDYNVAHLEIDVHDPEGLKNISGFLIEEREWFDRFLALGFVDVYRHFYPDVTEQFTWWDQRTRARLANRGWRIDYFCASQGLLPRIKGIEILDDQEGSDHCPIVLEME